MSLPITFIHVAGVVHLLVASANVFAFRKFRYLEHLRNVPLVMRQVFLVQNAYVMLVQVGLALACFRCAGDLTSGLGLGFGLAIFWSTRVLLQLFYYDRELRRDNRFFDVLFLVGDGYLATVFILAAALPTFAGG